MLGSLDAIFESHSTEEEIGVQEVKRFIQSQATASSRDYNHLVLGIG